MSMLEDTLYQIEPLNREVMAEVRKHLDQLTKPTGSLGVLEDIVAQLGGITGQAFPDVSKKAVVVMAADHGVAIEGVSAYPQEVTAQMVQNFIRGGAAINVLARHTGATVVVVDVGVVGPVGSPQVRDCKIRPGTANIARGPAMSREEALRALEVGIELASELSDQGYQLLATGEMGIGNTTPSSALTAVFLGISPAEVTGRGTGLSNAGLASKTAVIRRTLEVNRPDPGDPLGTLASVGGLEIAALAGLILGAAAHRIPVVIDGFITTAAALVAARLKLQALDYVLASHCSAENAHRRLLDHLKLRPMIDLDMRLGEGTGAVLAFPLIEAATRLLREMATFETAGISNRS
ncbi:MAG TPA: nicotinate-nucleotide--dimethylbenzimidazole phosphoribosyltransferase [Bacillota bacterium]